MQAAKVKWGILGTSYISEVMAKAIQASEIGELHAIGSRSTTTAELFANKFSVPHFHADYQSLLNDKEIDAIYIGLPNHLHKEWVIKCAQVGKHILCEKPFVLDLQEAEEAFAAVAKAKVICMEALMYRYHPLTKKLQSIIQERTLGDIKLFNATYTANIADVANTTAGGSIRNLGCYPVSLVRLLADDEPIAMTAMGRINQYTGNDNQASTILRFADNVTAVVSTADDLEMFWQFDVYGTKGCLKMLSNPWLPDHENKFLLQINNEPPQEHIITAEKPLYTYQIDAINNKICYAKNDNEITWQDSMGNVAILEAWLKMVLQAEQEALTPIH